MDSLMKIKINKIITSNNFLNYHRSSKKKMINLNYSPRIQLKEPLQMSKNLDLQFLIRYLTKNIYPKKWFIVNFIKKITNLTQLMHKKIFHLM